MGIQCGAGGDASIAELESAGTRHPKWLIQRAQKFLDAGAHVCSFLPIKKSFFQSFSFLQMIMIESEGITKNVKSWRTDVISAITFNLPLEEIM